ncbi:MAG: type II toxin-antitoxin system VapC family toxin [Myxococcota bacterium]|nr:type II toxin-antitoxin system VapC family toxin [Myxococcota bacterium]
MIVYAETSAVLRWLFGEPEGETVRRHLAEAERVVSSHLTILECYRSVVRLEAEIQPQARTELRSRVGEIGRHWTLVEIDAPVRARAAEPFPVEPVRTLDAIHLATMLELARDLDLLCVLSFDRRIVDNARALGIRTAP